MPATSYNYYPEEQEGDAFTTARFYRGLKQLSHMPGMAENFGWCLAKLASSPDYESQFVSMVEFYGKYYSRGLDRAISAVEDVESIPVNIVQLGEGRRGTVIPGAVVGLLQPDTRRKSRFFGIAQVRTDNLSGEFIPVLLDANFPGDVLRLNEESTDRS